MIRIRALLVASLPAVMLTGTAYGAASETADELLAARPSMAGTAFVSPVAQQPRYEDELRAARKKWGKDSLQAAEAMVMLAHATPEQWRMRALFHDALKIVAAQAGEDHRLYGRYLLEAGSALAFMGAYRSSDDFLDRADAFYGHATFADLLDSARVDIARAMVFENDGKPEQAAIVLGRAAQLVDPYVRDHQRALELAITARSRALAALEAEGLSDAATPHVLELGRLGAPDGNAPPKQVHLVTPEYPRMLMVKGIEGEVVFRLTVTADGFVEEPVVESVTGPKEFADALLRVIGDWRFAPRIVDGQPVSARLRNRYYFTAEPDPDS